MRSKRVTKLLACTLCAAMCAGSTTVLAASVEYGDYATQGGTINTEFGVASPELKVTVPIKAKVAVNPLNDSSATTGTDAFEVASKELIITNKTVTGDTSANRTGAKILVTVTGTVTAGTGVKAYYKLADISTNGTSKAKKLYMQLDHSASNLSENNVFNLADDNEPASQTMTSIGSRIQFSVDAPAGPSVSSGNVSANDQKYGAFAVIGKANNGADWVTADMTVGLKYEIKASTATPVTSPALGNGVTNAPITSTNGISVNSFLMDTDLDGAYVTKMALVDKDADLPETVWEEGPDGFTFERNSTADGWNLKVSKDNPAIAYVVANTPATKKNTQYYLLIAFNDGRCKRIQAPIQ